MLPIQLSVFPGGPELTDVCPSLLHRHKKGVACRKPGTSRRYFPLMCNILGTGIMPSLPTWNTPLTVLERPGNGLLMGSNCYHLTYELQFFHGWSNHLYTSLVLPSNSRLQSWLRQMRYTQIRYIS